MLVSWADLGTFLSFLGLGVLLCEPGWRGDWETQRGEAGGECGSSQAPHTCHRGGPGHAVGGPSRREWGLLCPVQASKQARLGSTGTHFSPPPGRGPQAGSLGAALCSRGTFGGFWELDTGLKEGRWGGTEAFRQRGRLEQRHRGGNAVPLRRRDIEGTISQAIGSHRVWGRNGQDAAMPEMPERPSKDQNGERTEGRKQEPF